MIQTEQFLSIPHFSSQNQTPHPTYQHLHTMHTRTEYLGGFLEQNRNGQRKTEAPIFCLLII